MATQPATDLAPASSRRWWALCALSLLLLLLAIDGTVLLLAIPSIASELGANSTQILWISDIYAFVLAGLLLVMGNIGDRIGRRRLLVMGTAGFGAASALAAFAPTTGWLIAARALQGLAGATLMPSTLSLLRNIFTDARERTFALGVWSAMGTTGAAIGPLLGGVLLEHYWWGSVLLINVPVVLVAIPAVLWSVDESRNEDAGPIDLLSALMSVVGLIAVIYGIKELARYGLGRPFDWLAIVVGLIVLTLFVRRQLHLSYPLFDVRLFRQPALRGALTALLLTILGVVGLIYFFALYLQTVDGRSPLITGLQLIPLVVASAVAAPSAAFFVHRFGRRRVATIGLFMEAVGLVGMLTLVGPGIGPLLWASMLLIGIGDGLALTTLVDSILAAAPPERAGAASAVSETSFELGNALGIALIGSLITASYRAALELPSGFPANLESSVTDSVTSALATANGLPANLADSVQAAAFAAFEHAFIIGSIVCAVLLFIGSIVAWRSLPNTDPEQAVSH